MLGKDDLVWVTGPYASMYTGAWTIDRLVDPGLAHISQPTRITGHRCTIVAPISTLTLVMHCYETYSKCNVGRGGWAAGRDCSCECRNCKALQERTRAMPATRIKKNEETLRWHIETDNLRMNSVDENPNLVKIALRDQGPMEAGNASRQEIWRTESLEAEELRDFIMAVGSRLGLTVSRSR